MDISHLIPLLDRANQIAANPDPDRLLDQTLALLMEVCEAKAGALYWLDETSQALTCQAQSGGEFEPRLVIEEGLAQELLLRGQPVHSEALPNSKFQNVIALPLLTRGELLGVIQLFDFNQPASQLGQLLVNRMASEIERSLLLKASQGRSQRFEALIAIIGQIGSSLDRDQILRAIINSACEFLNAEACSLFLTDETLGDLVLAFASNINERVSVEQMRVPAGKGIIGHTVQTGETVLVADALHDERHYGGVDRKSGFVTRSILAVPLRSQTVELGGERGATRERIIGGLEALNKLEGTFNEEDAHFLRILANQAATVLEIASLYADANELSLNVVKSLTASIDAKDPYTVGHSERVSKFSVEIARELGLPPDVIHHIRIGSLLHDVGKIGVPDAILTKPGKLTEAEFDLMKQHPAIGGRIMSQVRMLRAELPIIAEHQERLDGSGYPAGLKNGQISLASRIVTVADVFDALTSDRPYHRAMSAKAALDFLRERADTLYDRACVDALARAHRHRAIRAQKQRSRA